MDSSLQGGEEELSPLVRNTSDVGLAQRRRSTYIYIGIGIILTAAIIVVTVLFFYNSNATPQYQGVILMVSDGFGPASQKLARDYYQAVNKLPYNDVTSLDEILIGTSRTRSSDSLITDSAAGATAFSCGIKTYNGGVGVFPNKLPCGTILEAAKAKGFLTGIVVRTRVTDATPAAFTSHTISRLMEDDIARYQVGNYSLGRNVDVLLGGGRCYFQPKSVNGSCRGDNLDVLEMATNSGFDVITSKSEFDNIDPSTQTNPILGLFNQYNMPYVIDRDPASDPTLPEMAQKTIDVITSMLDRSDSEGFFIMIEGSRIDTAAHSNDPATHIHEILEYHQTISVVRNFVDNNPNVVMISVSDHETGGLSVGRQVTKSYPAYLWKPKVLMKVQNSVDFLADMLRKFNGTNKAAFVRNEIFKNRLGIHNYSSDDVEFLTSDTALEPYQAENYLANMTSFRAQVGWTTQGHTGVDVNLYGYGNGLGNFGGNVENTDIGTFISNYLDLDLSKITQELQNVHLGLNKPGTEDDIERRHKAKVAYEDSKDFHINRLSPFV